VELSEHLFRRESGRLVAALVRIFGVHNLALAEDVVQDAFCRALDVWKIRGVPDNPSAWLMTVAKRRALDVVRRERTARTFAPEIARWLESEWTLAPVVDESFTSAVIRDEQLRMMFSCCHPSLSEETQIALILNVLCGFGASEVANAFLSSRAAMEKRIARGKKSLASAERLFDLSDDDFGARLAAVRSALYLLFNEGYHSASSETAVRAELCGEAIRLTSMLLETEAAAEPATFALAALMCLHAARLPARLDAHGDLSSLIDQDRSRWDVCLIERGRALLEQASSGSEATPYHLEAAIAAVHAGSPSIDSTNWDAIVQLYDRLSNLTPSPVVALNRAVAIAQRDGPDAGLVAIRAIPDADRLRDYPFYPAAIGELELRRGDLESAARAFSTAVGLARNPLERRFLERRLRVAQATSHPAAAGQGRSAPARGCGSD
jgi:RNA polymerase sigma-70 factor (ECF subfamily)